MRSSSSPQCWGSPSRRGEIVEVIGDGERQHYRVRWDDGHDPVIPGSGRPHRFNALTTH